MWKFMTIQIYYKCATNRVLMVVVIVATGCATVSVTIETLMKWDLAIQDHVAGNDLRFE